MICLMKVETPALLKNNLVSADGGAGTEGWWGGEKRDAMGGGARRRW